VEHEGRTHVPGQGNNAYIFPGVGLGVIASGARFVTDEMFATAARTLAHEVLDSDLKVGRVYPALTRIRDVSAVIATAVAELAYRRGLARFPRPEALDAQVRSLMFDPSYESYV
jgi:malate dehydrogenase (oxaloacetate-decarboxylating)(NADP+)